MRPAIGAAIAVCALALPATATGSRVSVARVVVGTAEAPTLVVESEPGESNRVFVDDDPSCQQFPVSCNTFTVRDLGAPLEAVGPHCRQLTANAASCTGARIGDTRQYSVRLADGLDQLTVNSAYLTAGGAIDGGTGDDAFSLPRRARDSISGGAGRDTLSYLGRTSGGGVKVDTGNDGLFDDGQSGEDRVFPDVEQVTGTNFDDVIFVPNQSASGRVPHGLVSGANGNDTLFGSPFQDTLNGGAGLDTLTAGLGDDLLEGRENAMAGQTVARDELRCGGGIDTAVMDLQDVQSDCENRSIAAIDEGGTVAIRTRAATIRRGRVRLLLSCPRSAKTPCHGRLTLRRAGRRLGATSYRIAKGASRRIAVRVRGRAGVAQATAAELDSKRRPKTTLARVVLR